MYTKRSYTVKKSCSTYSKILVDNRCYGFIFWIRKFVFYPFISRISKIISALNESGSKLLPDHFPIPQKNIWSQPINFFCALQSYEKNVDLRFPSLHRNWGRICLVNHLFQWMPNESFRTYVPFISLLSSLLQHRKALWYWRARVWNR